MTNVNYNLRYVAFLDLLGFKNMVNQSVENQTILNNINRALNYIGGIQHDNYNGINIDNVKDIPIDYEGMMGVPITFIDKFNPREFEILGCSYSYGDPGEAYHKQGESFNVSFNDKNVYKRIFIRNLNPISRSEDRGY